MPLYPLQEREPCKSLLEVVKQIKPTVVIGLSDGPPPHAFTKEVCEAVAAGAERPVILPLSRLSPEGRPEASEAAAADILAWTQGRAFVADRMTSGDVTLPNGKRRHLRAIDTTYVFPGGLPGALAELACPRAGELASWLAVG